MKIKPPSGPKKQSQNKPNSNPILSAVGGFRKAKIACQKIWPHPQKRKAQEKSGFFLNSLIYWQRIDYIVKSVRLIMFKYDLI